MKGIRKRIIFAITTLILLVLIALGLLLGQLFKNFYMSTFEERLEKEAQLLSAILNDQEVSDDRLNNQMKKMSEQLDADITVFSGDGELLINTYKNERLNKELKKMIDHPNYRTPLGFHVKEKDDGLFHYVMKLDNQHRFQGYLILSLSVNSVEHVNQQIWALLMTSLGLAFVVILMLGTRITNQYTKPIEAATRVANELAKGNYRARTYEGYVDETGMLSQSINILARNLQQITTQQEMQQDRLRTLIESMGSGLILIDGKGYIHLVNKFFIEFFEVELNDYIHKLYYHAFQHKEIVEIVEEIFLTETHVRKQLHLPLKIERRHFEVYGSPIIGTNEEWKGVVLVFHDITELKKLEQMRKDFVANVSHELKTPITSISGFTETLLDGAMEDKNLRENFLNIILKESERLQSLINDLLELSKIEQEGFTLNIQYVDLRGLLQEVLMILEGKVNEKGLTMNIDLGREKVTLEGDPHRLKQIFINLINNAIAYTPSGGEIDVVVTRTQENVKVLISDTGIGMDENEIPRIFERFYRIDRARSRNSGGTGLGLAIVKHLLEAHKGEIDVQSKAGEGTKFIVSFDRSF